MPEAVLTIAEPSVDDVCEIGWEELTEELPLEETRRESTSALKFG
jgi:hypothetical protein